MSGPPTNRLRWPLILGYFLLCAALVRAERGPYLFKVAGLPEGQQQYWCAEQLAGGWAAGTSEGVVIQERNAWKLVRPPAPGYVRTIAHYAGGLVVTGERFFFLYSNGKWLEQKVDDEFSSATSVSGTALLVGRRGVWAVSPKGEIKKLRDYSGNSNLQLQWLDNRVYVFPPKENALVWDGARLTEVGTALPWASQVEIASVQKLPGDEIFIAASRGLFFARGGDLEPVLAAHRREFLSEGLIGAHVFGRLVVVVTFSGGVRVFTLDGDLIWRAAAANYGSVYFSRYSEEGLLLGTSSGLFVLPDPSRFSYAPLPAADFLFSGPSVQGRVVGLSTGVVDLRGETIDAPGLVVSSLLLKDGRQVWGSLGKLTIEGKDVALPGTDVVGLAERQDGSIVALQAQGLTLLDPNAGPHPLRTYPLRTSTPNSLARTSTDGWLVGTSEGVLSFFADGSQATPWGNGVMRVKNFRSRAVVMDTQGHVFSETGEVLVSLPPAEILDIEEWRGATWVLARFPDQTVWLGTWSSGEGKWTPYDVPLGRSAHALAAGKDSLFMVCAGHILELHDPRPLSLPNLRLAVGGDFEIPVPISTHLSSEVDSVALLFPSPRLGPWNNPSYRVRVDKGRWEQAAIIPQTRVTRLGWGRSTLDVVGNWAGTEKSAALTLTRDWPWWGRWPAVVIYLLALVGSIYLTIIWRTRRLRKRAEVLEQLVESRTAELKKAQKAREEFFSTISHEIRNPLNGVVGICDILGHLDDSDPRRTRRHVKTLRGCADQLRTILDDVLDFSRIDRGDIQIYDEAFELTAAIDGAARSVDPGLERATLKLPVAEVWVHGDQGKIRQIVTNLVSNALKYGLPSAAQVFLEAEEGANGRINVSIRVRNTGSTLSQDQLDRIFTEFVRGEDALKRRIPGSGLGLAVSKRMAEAMKGNLSASSEDGLTEFKLSLGLQRGEPVQEHRTEAASSFGLSRALAIEDEEYNRTVLGFHLAQLGYQVDWAKDGTSALQWIKEASYDLILTDFMLPDMTGDELAKQILRLLPHPQPPIIAVTAYSTPDKIAQAKAAGITGFVTKPVSRKKLSAAILGATSNAEARTPIKPDPAIKCDFGVFGRLDDGRRLLAEYAEALNADWDAIAKECLSRLGQRAMLHAVHTFKSRVLVAHATDVAEQLGLLEEAVQESREADATRLLAVIRPMIQELAERAREEAFVGAAEIVKRPLSE